MPPSPANMPMPMASYARPLLGHDHDNSNQLQATYKDASGVSIKMKIKIVGQHKRLRDFYIRPLSTVLAVAVSMLDFVAKFEFKST